MSKKITESEYETLVDRHVAEAEAGIGGYKDPDGEYSIDTDDLDDLAERIERLLNPTVH